ncbi:MBL fold metallo-hydrolase [Mangrovibacterium lignilyticum]|uniref:MBL fold metallo-hydrolase n=1 Tax=Mangrovibacterium lignilyticum TaxID=2668052 RepID=UPI0013CFD46A|nr:MBL fold metallo-hydrolase [Mangrovibacterium lignilyticum]
MIVWKVLLWIAVIALVLLVAIFVAIKLNPAFGGKLKGERLIRAQQSSNFRDGKFQNPVETEMQTDDMPFFKVMREFFFVKGDRVPDRPIPVVPLDAENFKEKPGRARITWLGHSTLIIEINHQRILVDPVFGKRVSPFSFLGTKAFDYSPTYSLKDLPPIDLVLISHDHYDHLDYEVIKQLKDSKVPFVTALGVGAHLEYWGVQADRITELDWWESYTFAGSVHLTAASARHFSGRGLTNRFSTLWASWIIDGGDEKLFFGADSGYYPGFKTIGEKFGPFDLVMLECGQYSRYWPLIHMAPEETYLAANELKAKALLPIHWGKYKLSIHPWKEPVERLLKAAGNDSVRIATPRIGERFQVSEPLPANRWWREI